MDSLHESKENKKSFVNHVFNMTEEGKAEIFNVVQYAVTAIIPIILLNKLIQSLIPDADLDNSSLVITIEIVLQILLMFVGVVVIHRVITYIPTFSGFQYDSLSMTSVILLFLILILSIQTKIGIKTNILYDRALDLWNGNTPENTKKKIKKNVRVNEGMAGHNASQADYLDSPNTQGDMYPPAPSTTNASKSSGYNMMRGGGSDESYETPIMAANTLLGGNFGSRF